MPVPQCINVTEHYEALIARGTDALKALANDNGAILQFTGIHNYLGDLDRIYEIISDRPEYIVSQLSMREYQLALYAASVGNYRYAYIGLRLFFELSLASIYFSAHEIILRKWIANKFDINWRTITDENEGVFSKSFISAFTPELAEYGKQYLSMSSTVYRECSEFVHGNSHTHEDPAHPIGFDQQKLLVWMGRAEAVHLSVIFAFTSRYIALLPAEARNALEPMIMGNFGHIPAIQDLYAK